MVEIFGETEIIGEWFIASWQDERTGTAAG